MHLSKLIYLFSNDPTRFILSFLTKVWPMHLNHVFMGNVQCNMFGIFMRIFLCNIFIDLRCVRTVLKCTTAENSTLKTSTTWPRSDRTDTNTPIITSARLKRFLNLQDHSQRRDSYRRESPSPHDRKATPIRRYIINCPTNSNRSKNPSPAFPPSEERRNRRNTSRKLSRRCRNKTPRPRFTNRFLDK